MKQSLERFYDTLAHRLFQIFVYTHVSDQTPASQRHKLLCLHNFPKHSATLFCAKRSNDGRMLSSEQILEDAARDGSIDMYVPPHVYHLAHS
jgi:hypothetical protein